MIEDRLISAEEVKTSLMEEWQSNMTFTDFERMVTRAIDKTDTKAPEIIYRNPFTEIMASLGTTMQSMSRQLSAAAKIFANRNREPWRRWSSVKQVKKGYGDRR
jgi:hypothetical protein